MGRTKRKRKKRQSGQVNDFNKVINLQKSLGLKCPNIQPDYFHDTGWGIRCKKKLEKEEILIALPLKYLITKNINCEIFSVLNVESQSPQFLLSVFLVYELHLGKDSKYFDYIESLPKSFTNLYFCTEEEIKLLPEFLKVEVELQKTLLDQNIEKLLQLLNNKLCPHCKEFLRNIYTKEKFIWAWFIVNTRSVFYEDEKHNKSLALAPFLDLFNHSDEAVTEMSIDFKNELYVLRTLVEYKKFEQAFIKYGDHSNLKLLVEYGFILPRNKNDFVEFSFEEVVESFMELYPNYGEITTQKYNFIKSNKLNQYLIKNTDFSWNFIGLISVLTTEDQNLLKFQSNLYSNTFTPNEKNIKRISDYILGKKHKKLMQNLLEMEKIENCTESFDLAKKLLEIYMSFLK